MTENTDLVHGEGYQPARREESIPGLDVGMVWTSYGQAEDRETRIAVYNALTEPAQNLRDWMQEHPGEYITVEHVASHQISLTDETTGEVTDCTRIVLISPTGERWEAVAQGVAVSIGRLAAIVGRPPWTPALPLRPVLQKTRRGFYTLTLAIVQDDGKKSKK